MVRRGGGGADAYARMAKADNTRRAYRATVCAWCDRHGLPALPAAGADVAAFLAGERAGQRLAPNTVRDRRQEPADGPARPRDLAGRPAGLTGLHDRAIILVGFAGALRRAELAAIRVEHLEKTERGIRLTLPHTKGPQTAAVTVALTYRDTALCPVRALECWLAAAGITEGPVFRRLWLPPRANPDEPPPPHGPNRDHPQSVAQIIQARAVAADFRRRDLGGHSLKRGALAAGMERGIHPAKLKRLGRHKSFDVLGAYLEFGDQFDGHPLSGVL